ncbi:OmpH family outer membrane protein [Endozoicomonas sp. 8E]|uniref:OmpH family outer membrane protein n=1 Tax=Endozoicomonas sp. 8E TaxID=3035692 RepID=UPI00293923ED|nr:OmpH family outer membrane protein [Endozoicomonas sp. 8E]WOG25465.1 OmpH family outer membrane protein [Endozoicomonas sp. 8E]
MKSIKLAFVALLLLSPLAQAQKIAVVDSEMAVLESDAAKKYAKEAEKMFAPKIKQLKALQEEIRVMEQKLQKDGPTLTEGQRENRQVQIKRKFEDLQLQDRQLRSEKARSDQTELGKLRPKLDKAIEEVSKEQDYDLVLERGAARFVKPGFDITRKVIERMNKLK